MIIRISAFILMCLLSGFIVLSGEVLETTPLPPMVSREIQLVNLGMHRYYLSLQEPIVNISPEEAEKRAIDRARQHLVEHVCGMEVSNWLFNVEGEIASQAIDNLSKITSIMSRGYITEMSITESKNVIIGSNLARQVSLEMTVKPQIGDCDPYFSLRVQQNRSTFEEGEKLKLSITPSQDCYLSILNLYSNDTVSILLPNEYKDNYAKANTAFQFPSERDSFSIPLSLLPGKNQDVETIMVVATKKPITLIRTGTMSSYNTVESSINELMSALSKLPRSEYEFAFISYSIYKKK